MTVEDVIELLKKMPPKATLKISEDGSVYDWNPTRAYSNDSGVYLTNKKPKRTA